VKLMTAALRTSRCIDRGFSSWNMRRLVRVMPRRRLEKAVNKVADDTSNLRLKALPVRFVPVTNLHLFNCPTCFLLAESETVNERVWVSPDKLAVAGFRFFALAA
jgi:hypothetical protein